MNSCSLHYLAPQPNLHISTGRIEEPRAASSAGIPSLYRYRAGDRCVYGLAGIGLVLTYKTDQIYQRYLGIES